MDAVELRYGVDVLDGLRGLAAGSVHCVVTSPPYWGLRDYGTGAAQIGLEAIPDCLGWATGRPCGACYVCHLVAVFREVRRVLRDDGTVWLNLGDSYANKGNKRNGEGEAQRDMSGGLTGRFMGTYNNHKTTGQRRTTGSFPGLKPKDLCMIPARVALALQADGWYLRQDIIWAKKAPMPESVTDRLTKSHEYVWLLAKSPRYYWDAVAVAEENSETSHTGGQYKNEWKYNQIGMGSSTSQMRVGVPIPRNGRNRRDVLLLGPDPYPGAHFATMPRELAQICILAGTSAAGCCVVCGKPWVRVVVRGLTAHDGKTASLYKEGSSAHRMSLLRQAARARGEEYNSGKQTIGWRASCTCAPADPIPCTVLDPFSGSGTTAAVAKACGRAAIGLDLNPAYLPLAEDRIVAVTAPLVPMGYEDAAPEPEPTNGYYHTQEALFA